MKRTVKIINILMIAVILFAAIANVALAIDPSTINPTTAGTGVTKIKTLGEKIVGIIQVVGSIVTVVMIAVLGVKYMMGSAEEKAEYKKTIIPLIIGAVLVFAAVNIGSMVYNMAKQV